MTRSTTTGPGMGPLPAARGCDCQICRPEAAYDPVDRRVIDTVLEHGWQVLAVGDDVACCHPDGHDDQDHHDHDDDSEGAASPTFAYTVGLGHRCGHPELLVSGLDPGLMLGVLDHVARRVMNGVVLAPGAVLEGVLAGVPVVLEEVAETALEETVCWSGWFHRRRPRALALVWPDTAGVFAWQPGATDALEQAQPNRWWVPLQHGGGLAVDPPWPFSAPPDSVALSCVHVVDGGDPVGWTARQSHRSVEDLWIARCGREHHDASEDRLVHLAHLIRSAPSLRHLRDLRPGEAARRPDPDSPWTPCTTS